MSVLISDEEYKEYRILQDNARFQLKLASVRGMVGLKYDIDDPVRKLVAMFALLGCQPMWSCCGFDYDGQPMHKSHEYGNLYIMLNRTERNRCILNILLAGKQIKHQQNPLETDSSNWMVRVDPFTFLLSSDFDYEHAKMQYPWSTKSCPHYYELSVFRIWQMEQLLMTYFGDEFMDEVVLKDTNRVNKEHNSHWQYPPLAEWVITLEDIK